MSGSMRYRLRRPVSLLSFGATQAASAVPLGSQRTCQSSSLPSDRAWLVSPPSGQVPTTTRPVSGTHVTPSSARVTVPSHQAARVPSGERVGSQAAWLWSSTRLPVASTWTVLGVPLSTRLTRRLSPAQSANTDRWSSVMARAIVSLVSQT